MCMAATPQQSNNIGMGLQLGGGIGSAFAAQAYHDSNANYLDSMSQVTKIMSDKAVDSAAYAGGMAESAARAKGQSLIGSQKAAMASRGLSSGSFTYQNILDDTTARSELDALAIQYNTDVQQQNIRNDANMKITGYNSQAAAERTAGKIAFTSGLLSTGTQFFQNYSKWADTSQGKTGSSGASSPMDYSQFNKNFYTGNKALDNSNIAGSGSFFGSLPSWKQASYLRGGSLW